MGDRTHASFFQRFYCCMCVRFTIPNIIKLIWLFCAFFKVLIVVSSESVRASRGSEDRPLPHPPYMQHHRATPPFLDYSQSSSFIQHHMHRFSHLHVNSRGELAYIGWTTGARGKADSVCINAHTQLPWIRLIWKPERNSFAKHHHPRRMVQFEQLVS